MRYDTYGLDMIHEPWSAAWWRAVRDEHLKRYPELDARSRANLDDEVRRAEERERADAEARDPLTWTAVELDALTTLCVSQADDLKVDAGDTRVWLSRCSAADGEPFDNKVTVERLTNGRWETVSEYPG